mgnify:CR=1 FL=1
MKYTALKLALLLSLVGISGCWEVKATWEAPTTYVGFAPLPDHAEVLYQLEYEYIGYPDINTGENLVAILTTPELSHTAPGIDGIDYIVRARTLLEQTYCRSPAEATYEGKQYCTSDWTQPVYVKAPPVLIE